MSDSTLSQCVNIRKAVARNARYSGFLGVEQLPQYEGQLPSAGEPLQLCVDFAQDDQGQQYLAVDLQVDVAQECQRCLQPVQLRLHSASKLGLVPDDERAQQLTSEYEPLIAIDEVDLWQIAAEELALALPVVAYHPSGECNTPDGGALQAAVQSTMQSTVQGTVHHGKENEGARSFASEADDSGEVRANPFSVLSALLDSGESKE